MNAVEHKYLRLQDLRRLRYLLFTSRRRVEGVYAGRHASPQRGHSVEFSDYRPYMPGDELGDIDWKVFARSDKLFVKIFEHQSDMAVHLLLDASASMAYAGTKGLGPRPSALHPDSKYDHACRMAAAIAFLVSRQQDRVSLGVAQEGLKEFLKAQGSPSHLLKILDAMEQTRPGKEARLAQTVTALASQAQRRGMLIVFSDLLDEAEPLLKAMAAFRHRGGEVTLFHTLHPDELKLPNLDDAIFIDSEARGRMTLNIPDLRPDYEERMARFLRTWSAACAAHGFDYRLVNTGVEYHRSLEQYLFTRNGTR